ncbi:uncharacterized protein METZ01_LOCUS392702, partial [marine metagenome]
MAEKQIEATELYIEAMELQTPSATIPLQDKCIVFNL